MFSIYRFFFSTVGAKRVFLQPLLSHNIDSIIQIIIYFFSDNANIIYWMKETNSCFFENCKQSTHQDSTKFIYSIWMDMTKQPTNFFPDECFVRKWRLKFQVSKYRLRWSTENMTSSIMSPQKKLHYYRFYEHFKTENQLVCSQEMTVLTSGTCTTQL